MISAGDFYKVLSAIAPLYVAMILAYGSVRWWRILTPEQCGGINRFVAIFAVPFLSFHIIATNNPYKMNLKFIAADTLQKIAILIVLAFWARYSRTGTLEWMITLFMLATLPNTLVMGIPLLAAMYGAQSGALIVQAVVLQCIIWYTLLLFLYEFRSAKALISEQFPDNAASIVSFKVKPDVMSLDGRDPLQTEAEIDDDGKLHVTVRRSTSSQPHSLSSPRRSTALSSMPALTPRPSNLTGVEIFSIPSSRNITPRESSFNPAEFYSISTTRPVGSPCRSNFTSAEIYSLHSSRALTPRSSDSTEDNFKDVNRTSKGINGVGSPFPAQVYLSSVGGGQLFQLQSHISPSHPSQIVYKRTDPRASPKMDDISKDQMFVWSTSASPVSEGGPPPSQRSAFSAVNGAKRDDDTKEVKLQMGTTRFPEGPQACKGPRDGYNEYDCDDFSFGNRASSDGSEPFSAEKAGSSLTKTGSSSTALHPKLLGDQRKISLPPAIVMSKLILNLVWRKLIRNPNTYSSLLGLIWALVSYRWHKSMPEILENSVTIISNAGLGMAMFSLGLSMALQKKILSCGVRLSLFGMVVRFMTGPAVMAATSIAVGLRGVNLRVSIVQAALPQGIVPFVFAKEYNLHSDVLSTAVIFGMLVSFPITLLYYIMLGL
ncbi:hypothetical protein O6H91_18G051200 [Diphasiastrum complanatum]|uniref:Uncharacterized protein n=1 Tax=Diphasiastrum complanatum TaxID=34168 RepID=A0ACC2B117_DIPCM|nr:hypothetical protein O6H91_18G051200 [Diphasiastrum complanatum]